MNKYLVTETIPYESIRTFTVFAEDAGSAIDLVANDIHSVGDRSFLSYDILKSNLKGTKDSRVHKVSSSKCIL